MKKVMISQNIFNVPDKTIKETYDTIALYVKKYLFPDTDIEFVDGISIEPPNSEDTKQELYYLAKRLEMLSHADVLVIAPDEENNGNCPFERQYAVEFDIRMIFIDNPVNILKNIRQYHQHK